MFWLDCSAPKSDMYLRLCFWQHQMLTPEERRAKIGAVIRVASGNFLEMYNFIVYGYYAVYIGNAFFPSHSKFASLMLSLMTFGIGFLMRPLGAVFLGAYIDRKGRREKGGAKDCC